METELDERPWHKSYPQGMPHHIDLEEGLTLSTFFERSCVQHADRAAYSVGNVALSYAELGRRSKALASYLIGLGLTTGDRVALMLPNSLVYPIALNAILQAGLTVVSVNPMYTARELLVQLQDSGARAIIAAQDLLTLILPLLGVSELRHVIHASAEELVPRDGNWLKQRSSHRDSINFSSAVLHGAAAPRALPVSKQSDIAFLQYTGGTTGVSKGAALSHANLLACVAAQSRWLAEGFQDGTHCVTSLPLYHIYPLNVALMLIGCGGTNRLVANPRDIGDLMAELRRATFHVLPGVNTLFNSLLASGELTRADFRGTRLVIGAGASVQRAVAVRWIEETGCPIREGYGLTECSPSVAFNVLGGPDWTGSIGLPIPSTDVMLVNLSGKEVAVDEAGEILVRGPQVFSGYWQRPDETSKVLSPDGWLRTGDIGVMDQNGFLKIVDRLKDMILVSGFNVYPNELEGVVATMPEVLECACVGQPDERSGEVPHMYIVRRDSSLTVSSVEAYCRKNLTAYKIPRHFTFVDALPKSAVGKILRRELRAPNTATSTDRS